MEAVEEACRAQSPSLVINVDETSVRTVRAPRTAVARKGWDAGRKPILTVTRSEKESTSLACAVAANGNLLQPCVLRSRRSEAGLREDNRWVSINCVGWSTAEVYMEYVWRVILPYTRGKPLPSYMTLSLYILLLMSLLSFTHINSLPSSSPKAKPQHFNPSTLVCLDR